MKKFYLLMLVILIGMISTFSQTPQAFKYQSVVRDNAGDIVANQAVSFRITIHQGTAGGTIVYQETHSASTNSFGVVNFNIGEGTVVSSVFNNIDWSGSEMFMEVELDPAGGSAYISMGTTQLLSVPYALYADKSGSAPANH